MQEKDRREESVYFNASIINFAPYPGEAGVGFYVVGMFPRTLTLSVYADFYSAYPDPLVPLTCNILFLPISRSLNQTPEESQKRENSVYVVF